MNIDERINAIMKKMDMLSQKHPKFTCGEFPPEWDQAVPLASEYDKYKVGQEVTIVCRDMTDKGEFIGVAYSFKE